MTRQFGMYTYRIRGKRGSFKIILPDSFCSFLTPPGMSGSPPSFSDYLYFYSFMNRKIHAHFYKPQNKMFHFCKTFCSKITLVNTIQNVILNPI
ncbi:hypothetical protein F2Y51_11355 [Phocaeicola dorei]|uniref:Uncharacterized protein n=1 Tax=Phocaeicola dorei TaxID=357276 RepID=A0A4V1YXP1_9BACT|nr:hypothetical protein F2Y56_11240 [Phocaeicola dorei]KAA5400882.1 hypothetical protein F2Y58_01550 [Phocaeicola dorei]KAA5405068.1 hypothetical protein F2Y51_11355 [Phocaeicola dorei]RYT97585.1 hypothetical protein EAJ02_01545 [Phocaeicola dorei]